MNYLALTRGVPLDREYQLLVCLPCLQQRVRKRVRRLLRQRREDVVLKIDVQGAMQVRHHYRNAVLIFILPPDEPTLLQRLTDRARDSEDEINKRFRAARRCAQRHR